MNTSRLKVSSRFVAALLLLPGMFLIADPLGPPPARGGSASSVTGISTLLYDPIAPAPEGVTFSTAVGTPHGAPRA